MRSWEHCKSHFHMDYVWNACYMRMRIFSTLNICMNFNENQFFFKKHSFRKLEMWKQLRKIDTFYLLWSEVVIVVVGGGVRKWLDELLCTIICFCIKRHRVRSLHFKIKILILKHFLITFDIFLLLFYMKVIIFVLLIWISGCNRLAAHWVERSCFNETLLYLICEQNTFF